MTQEQIRRTIKGALRRSGQEACIEALTDIVTAMYVSEEEADVYALIEDREVNGGDLVEDVGLALLQGPLFIQEMLDQAADVRHTMRTS